MANEETNYYPREISGNTTAARPAIGQQLMFTFYERQDVLPQILQRLKNVFNGVFSGTTVPKLIEELRVASVELKRTKNIRLYVPHTLRNTLAISYEDISGLAMSVATDLANALSGKNNAGDIMNSLGSFANKNIGGLLAFAPDILSKTLTGILGTNITDSVLGGIKKTVGVVGNPEITTLFKNVSLRTFNFTYLFSPRDKAEAEQAHQIISYFKESALPGKGQEEHTLTFPREVEVLAFSSPEAVQSGLNRDDVNTNIISTVVANTNNTNPYLFRTKRCVITDFDVNYTPAGQHNVFSGAGAEKYAGMPTQIEMAIVLKETEIITRQDVQNKVAY